MIHWTVSVGAWAQRCGLTAGQVAVLMALWGMVRDPFAVDARVFVSYESLSRMTGLSVSSVRKSVDALRLGGCLNKGRSARGRGASYELLRPHHEADDRLHNPFEPSEAETAAEAAVEIMRADGRVVRPRARAKPEFFRAPPIEPSRIALALEHAAGIEPTYKEVDEEQVRVPSLPYSKRCGDPSAVRAAQRFISNYDYELFTLVCKAARERGEFKSDAMARARLFEDRALVQDLLTQIAAETGEPIAVSRAERTRKPSEDGDDAKAMLMELPIEQRKQVDPTNTYGTW